MKIEVYQKLGTPEFMAKFWHFDIVINGQIARPDKDLSSSRLVGRFGNIVIKIDSDMPRAYFHHRAATGPEIEKYQTLYISAESRKLLPIMVDCGKVKRGQDKTPRYWAAYEYVDGQDWIPATYPKEYIQAFLSFMIKFRISDIDAESGHNIIATTNGIVIIDFPYNGIDAKLDTVLNILEGKPDA